MIKEKNCKGNGKAKQFQGCNDLTKVEHLKYGLCLKCYRQWLTSDDENAKKTFQSFIIANKKSFQKEVKTKERELKDEIVDYAEKLQSKINEICRLIDIGNPCLARGYHANQIHGGHIFSRGSNKTIRFNLHNIHRQSAQSNHFQNEDGLLREGLINEYGESYYNYISELRKTPVLKKSNYEYKEYYKLACKIVLGLKKKGEKFSKNERVLMRNKINIELGIYDKIFCEFIYNY